jgi:DNA-binding protein HU-beta
MQKMEALVVDVARENGLTPKQADALVSSVFEVMSAMIEHGGVSVAGFGKFLFVDRPARPVRNPRTGETVMSKTGRKVVFRPAKPLRDRLSSPAPGHLAVTANPSTPP